MLGWDVLVQGWEEESCLPRVVKPKRGCIGLAGWTNTRVWMRLWKMN